MFLKLSGNIFHNEIARDKTDFCIEQDLQKGVPKKRKPANLSWVMIIRS